MVNISMYAKNCAVAQDYLTYFELIPAAGLIASAIRVILSVGELAAGWRLKDRNLWEQGVNGLVRGGANILTGGLFVYGSLLLDGAKIFSLFRDSRIPSKDCGELIDLSPFEESTSFGTLPLSSRLA